MANLTDIRSNWSTGASEGGVTVYATKENLPTTGLTSGDQAYVTNTSRLYISNGSGWYNVALINATPSLTIDPTGAIELAKDGSTPTVITLTATDSDNAVDGLTFSVDSDGSFAGLGTISQDSSVFTITPFSEDSATTTSSTLTFKASDGISFGSGTKTISLTFAVTNSNYTTLLLQADTAGTDNQVDASTNAHTITENGNVKSTALSPYHPGGYSYYFDGSGDYIQFPDHNDLDFGSSDFTMECWVYVPNPSITVILMGKRANSSIYGATYIALVGGNAVASATSHGSSWDMITSNTSFGAVSANTWTHLALVRNGNNFTGYVNGVGTSIGTSSDAIAANSAAVTIGGDTDGYQLTGYIRDVRWVKGTAVYTSNFTPPTSALTAITNTQLLACHLPYIADGSTNAHAITVAGNAQTRRFGPYDYLGYAKADHSGSVYFDGSGDYLRTSSPAIPASGDFTIETWVYVKNTSVRREILAQYLGGSPSQEGRLSLYVNSGAFSFFIGSTLGNVSLAGPTVATNTWYHLAVVRNSNNFYFYVNGVLVASDTGGKNITIYTGSYNTSIGSFYNGGWVNSMQGYIADSRVVSDAVYTADFTPPTAPLTAITNTQLLTCTNKNNIWDASSGSQLMTKSGNVTASNTQRQFTGSSAIYFDGNGDYLDFVQKDGYSFESGVDFTVEGWWYMNSVAGRPHFIGMGTGIDGTPAHYSDWNMYYNSGNTLVFYYYNGSTAIARQFAWTPVVNTWYHIAVSRSGTDLKAFINGTQTGNTITDSTNFSGGAGTRPLRIGRWQYGGGTNGYLNGYAQDIRITKGLARYTSNFTPPTEEFSG